LSQAFSLLEQQRYTFGVKKKEKKHQNEESDSDTNETPSFNKGGGE